jgi:S-adenosylmethionine synthetase
MELIVARREGLPVAERELEIVERKGLGHPDTICDALAERLSLELSRFYIDRWGFILHHNVDKALLWGGSARPAFGGGAILAPIEIYLTGRAIRDYEGVTVPVDELVQRSARSWLTEHFHALDARKHVKIHSLVRPGSADLLDLFLRQRDTGVWLANDTSCGVGYAPLSELETIVYTVERELNAHATKRSYPEFGEDVKVMGVRRHDSISLTVACAFVDRFIDAIEDYAEKKQRLADVVRQIAQSRTQRTVDVQVNTADDPDTRSVYLTVIGTSAEAGDDGEAGRGNRVNGLIAPFRPMTMESVAGKNPVTHVGKLYNLAAGLIASRVVEQVDGVSEAECYLVSQIGRPINDPQVAEVRITSKEADVLADQRRCIEDIVREELAQIGSLWRELLAGTLLIDRWPMRTGSARH